MFALTYNTSLINKSKFYYLKLQFKTSKSKIFKGNNIIRSGFCSTKSIIQYHYAIDALENGTICVKDGT